MKGPRPNKRLQFLLVALAAATALSMHGTFGEKRLGPPSTDEAAKVAPGTSAAAQPFPASAAPGQASTAGEPSGGPRPVAPSASSSPAPLAPPTRSREAVGRPNPFAPLVVPQRPLGPLVGLRPPLGTSRPSGPSAPSSGIDLPLPPGFASPGVRGAPPPLPGAGMTVGAIIGGSERVALILDRGKVFTVGVGDRVGDATVVQIFGDRVVMRRGAVTFDLPFGGEGP